MSDYFDRVERQIVRRVESGVPRSARLPNVFGHLGTAAAVLVVIVVAGVFLLARGATPTSTRPTGTATPTHGLTVAFAPETLPGGQAASAQINRTVQILSERLHQAMPGAHVKVAWTGGHFVVTVPDPTRDAGSQIMTLAAPGRVEFYDWEASVVTPNGKTVASQLRAQNPTALEISQGTAGAAPGAPGAGCVSLDEALTLAARQPASSTPMLMEAVGQGAGYPPGAQDPAAGYYVLRGSPALSGTDIVKPQQYTAPNGHSPSVTFGFTAAGGRAFRALTAKIAHRGTLVSRLGETLNQHFAVVLDGRLLEVPSINFKQYPDGITGHTVVELTAGLTKQSAEDIAILLRYGPLPISLTAAG